MKDISEVTVVDLIQKAKDLGAEHITINLNATYNRARKTFFNGRPGSGIEIFINRDINFTNWAPGRKEGFISHMFQDLDNLKQK